jgi:adenosylcobinamide-GDP ribazoletransferase
MSDTQSPPPLSRAEKRLAAFKSMLSRNGLASATGFLTTLPMGRDRFEPQAMVAWFPIVGILLGALIAMLDAVALLWWSRPVASLIDVLALLVLTGALHIDGLGDTADGLYGGRSLEKALAIMKDSRVGAMGVVAIFCGLSAKWAGLSGLDAHRGLLLVLIPAYARGAMIFGIRFLPYGRPEGGTGHALFKAPLPATAFAGLLVPVALSGFLGLRAAVLNLGFFLLVALILLFYKHRMGCITGDMLGAMVEILEPALFLLISAGGLR